MSKQQNSSGVVGVPAGIGPAYETWYAFGGDSLRYLEGKFLTLIDASIQDQEQRKALKDIVRQMIWEWATGDTCRVDYEDVKFRMYSPTGIAEGFAKNPALATKGK